jgi:hypothetical protein
LDAASAGSREARFPAADSDHHARHAAIAQIHQQITDFAAGKVVVELSANELRRPCLQHFPSSHRARQVEHQPVGCADVEIARRMAPTGSPWGERCTESA